MYNKNNKSWRRSKFVHKIMTFPWIRSRSFLKKISNKELIAKYEWKWKNIAEFFFIKISKFYSFIISLKDNIYQNLTFSILIAQISLYTINHFPFLFKQKREFLFVSTQPWSKHGNTKWLAHISQIFKTNDKHRPYTSERGQSHDIAQPRLLL